MSAAGCERWPVNGILSSLAAGRSRIAMPIGVMSAAGLLALTLVAGRANADTTPTVSACPPAVRAGTACYVGQDTNGAHYLIAIPENWNRVLVMHARGGPYREHLGPKRSDEDATRWAVWLEEGYAYAASQYRRGGFGVLMAAEDTENLRRYFVKTFGAPRRTIMHGQSWGGLVGARVIELYGTGPEGRRNYDAALLTSGVLAGAPRAYDFRLDLRVVYQHYCRNHPRPDELQYPLWAGLPPDVKITAAELRARVNECTGADLPAAKRSEAQRRNLANIVAVVRIPESSLQGHMNWATFMFADIVHDRLDGRNPFGNEGVRYAGSDDDAALNAGVARYRADPRAVATLAADAEPTGRTAIPTLTMHAIGDPTAFVENESAYRLIRERAGTQELLVQSFTDETEHSYLSTPEYAALMAALLDWVDRGRKPDVADVASRCAKYVGRYGESCRFEQAYQPISMDARSYPRKRQHLEGN